MLRPVAHVDDGGSSEGEHFATPSPTSSAGSLPGTLAAIAIASTQAPRSGPHSRQRSQLPPSRPRSRSPAEAFQESQPANKKAKPKRAVDVWTFFEKHSDTNHCTFCLYVIFSCTYLRANGLQYSKAIAAGQSVPNTTSYSATTSTTGLADHLAEFHISEWYESCQRLSITMKRLGAQKAIKQYLRTRSVFQPSMLSPDPLALREFSNENFADALVEWIIGDDQVSCCKFGY